MIIKDGLVIDGSGNPWIRVNVGIRQNKIEKISRVPLTDAKQVIDAKGLVVAPGFIDTHSHTDSSILKNPRAENIVRQGITTQVTGSCGTAVAPITKDVQEMLSRRLEIPVDWTTLKEYRFRVETQGIGLNLAPHCGHNMIRISVMGPEAGAFRTPGTKPIVREPTTEELEKMKHLVAGAMSDGAFGMAGILFGSNILPGEVIELCRVVAKYGGIYDCHIRSEDRTLTEAVREMIYIGRNTGIPVNIAHHKAMMPENWGKPAETLRLLEEARTEGIEITIDQYPWEMSAQSNAIGWFIYEGGNAISRTHAFFTPERIDDLLNQLKDPKRWEVIKQELHDSIELDWEEQDAREKLFMESPLGKLGILQASGGKDWYPGFFQILSHSKTHPEFIGKRFQEIAYEMGIEEWEEAIRKVILDDGGHTLQACGGNRPDDISMIMKSPYVAICTDGAAMDNPPSIARTCDPRQTGNHPKILEEYVREQKILRLEEVIRKMTSFPAQILGIQDRGHIKEGMHADIVIFDPEMIKNKATWEQPYQYPEGIPYVLVNGQIVIDEGTHTGLLPGKVLIHQI